MVEGGVAKLDKTEFTECWRTTWKTPYIMKLALSAGIGGLLFGYDTGVISGALLYIKEDFEEVDKKTWLQETILSTEVAGAIFGAGIGGWMNNRFGRRVSILVAGVLFFVGYIVMAVAMAQWMITLERIFVGFGVGMASMTAPLYISEASPARIRGALVSTNGLLITGGQFLAYLINLAFTHVSGLPALAQFILMLTLPESPRWLYRQNKVEEAKSILEKLYLADEVLEEINALRISVEAEKADEHAIGDSLKQKLKGEIGNVVVRRGLYAGVTVQIREEEDDADFNNGYHYMPFSLNRSVLAAAIRSPQLNILESTQFDANATCPSFKSAADAPSWNCMSCLKVECGFCANAVNESMSGSDERYEECMSGETSYLVQGWLPKQNWVPGSHTAGIVHHFLLPWDGNRAMGCQLRDLSTKVQRSLWRAGHSFQLGLQSHSQRVFLDLNQGSWFRWHLPPLYWVSVIGITCIYVFVPETKRLSFEEVEKLLETGFKPKAFRKKKSKE
ncbi:hypothetical protein Gotri_025002 [Gossypium trilobum]|uniref:Major facilitator superfamily (MFS) profile domain-containing protein n=1 Tax=Gossypium trilobum TaxID=34281 RepID=A0A7J9FVX7_9ROSI|nr:hypothetical protein [Gossypium trilobum]